MSSARRIAFNLFSFLPGATHLPFVRRTLARRSIGTGGTISPRYCYSVWMRHLRRIAQSGLPTRFETVAELGPGDSLGVGIAALLTGARRYFALDVVAHANDQTNLAVFGEIRRLVESRARIPDRAEFPEVLPLLDDWAFPSELLPGDRLAEALHTERLRVVETSICNPGAPGSIIQYKAPWTARDVVEIESVDLILSQAALEHVDDLAATYKAMYAWLRPGGIASHVIDFRSHGWTRKWDGHWACSDLAWKVLRGKDVWMINREPLSTHLKLLSDVGFRVVSQFPEYTPSEIGRQRLARRFNGMTDQDLTTSGALLIVQRV